MRWYGRYDYNASFGSWHTVGKYLIKLSPKTVALRHKENATTRYIPEEHLDDYDYDEDVSWSTIYDPLNMRTWDDVLTYWEQRRL